MKLFPNINYQFETLMTIDEIKNKLNKLLLNEDFEGFGEGNSYYVNRIVFNQKRIIPETSLNIIENNNKRTINIECYLKDKDRNFGYILLIVMGIIQVLLIFITIFSIGNFSLAILMPCLISAFYIIYANVCVSYESMQIKEIIRNSIIYSYN